MNDEKIGLWLRETEHICGHLWHIYSVAVNQVMMATVKLLNDDYEPFVQ